MKRLVRLKDKETGKVHTYSSVAELIRYEGEETLGIGLQALYNALSSKKKWENGRFIVFYQTIDLGNKEWA